MHPDTNIYLVGLPGSGKTTLGKVLSKKLNKEFFDSDHFLIERTGVSIKTIFDLEGEQGFREREKKAIQELTAKNNIVLATGGGSILNPDNRAVLKETGVVVYLATEPDFLYQRMKKDTLRPLLQGVDVNKKLQALYLERAYLYEAVSHLVYPINETNSSFYCCADELVAQIKAFLAH